MASSLQEVASNFDRGITPEAAGRYDRSAGDQSRLIEGIGKLGVRPGPEFLRKQAQGVQGKGQVWLQRSQGKGQRMASRWAEKVSQ